MTVLNEILCPLSRDNIIHKHEHIHMKSDRPAHGPKQRVWLYICRLFGRELQKWEPAEEDGDLLTLDDGPKGGKAGRWDQFEANRRQFGVRTSFNEDVSASLHIQSATDGRPAHMFAVHSKHTCPTCFWAALADDKQRPVARCCWVKSDLD